MIGRGAAVTSTVQVVFATQPAIEFLVRILKLFVHTGCGPSTISNAHVAGFMV